jgi:putative cell wall-binding protein
MQKEKKLLVMLLLICISSISNAQKKSYTISGFVKEKGTKESLIGTSIIILNNNNQATIII